MKNKELVTAIYKRIASLYGNVAYYYEVGDYDSVSETKKSIAELAKELERIQNEKPNN